MNFLYQTGDKKLQNCKQNNHVIIIALYYALVKYSKTIYKLFNAIYVKSFNNAQHLFSKAIFLHLTFVKMAFIIIL